jgi:hypothetical protein
MEELLMSRLDILCLNPFLNGIIGINPVRFGTKKFKGIILV